MPYRIECEFQPNMVILRVYEVQLTPQPMEAQILAKAREFTAPGLFVVDNTAKVWIGKKPNDTGAANAYAGVIDNVTISRSPT
ncbi:MAG: hypothetical protein H0U77_06490 [Nocardioidaceae bacterium]|jgi:hypothetical protein|nr:hypothetical protein [Nocardioidaceae bacterium]